MQHKALLEVPKVLIFSWGHTVPMIADAIGAELEKVDTIWEKWAATERIDYPYGSIEPGHCAAIRFEIRGWVDGEPRIVVEHCNGITKAAAPHWPRARMALTARMPFARQPPAFGSPSSALRKVVSCSMAGLPSTITR